MVVEGADHVAHVCLSREARWYYIVVGGGWGILRTDPGHIRLSGRTARNKMQVEGLVWCGLSLLDGKYRWDIIMLVVGYRMRSTSRIDLHEAYDGWS
jgi:hypothetical protein